MSLPLQAVERLFDRLIATYGTEFSGKYAGDIGKVKAMWAYELGGYVNNLGAIAYALETLPERAPNLIEFRNLCQKAPQEHHLQLDRPKADPEMVKMVLSGMKPAQKVNPLDWAHHILANKQGRSPTVVQMAKWAVEA